MNLVLIIMILYYGCEPILIYFTTIIFNISEVTLGFDYLWIVGDNFVASTFRNHFKRYTPQEEPQYIKENYEYLAHCNSQFSSSQTNILARLQSSLAAGITATNKRHGMLPKYILVILDDDLIQYLQFHGEDGVATLLGTWVQWLSKEFNSLIDQRMGQLPAKSKKVIPYFYWVNVPTHSFFTKEANQLRIKFNLSLDSVLRPVNNMRVIKIKDWDTKDSHLVINDHFTDQGLTTYWCAVDRSFKFNATRREIYLAKQFAVRSSSPGRNTSESGRKIDTNKVSGSNDF